MPGTERSGLEELLVGGVSSAVSRDPLLLRACSFGRREASQLAPACVHLGEHARALWAALGPLRRGAH